MYKRQLICDEVQTGLGRMGSLLASQYFDVKPDILLLGKALSGGMFPISAVLADDAIMDCMYPNTHGSTFGGNPLASVVAMESIRTILDEKMIENSKRIGHDFKHELDLISCFSDKITDIRGLGLMNAIEFNTEQSAKTIVHLCIEHGVLTKTCLLYTSPSPRD